MKFTFYYHPLASYCHKVLIALYENDIAFERRIIDFGNASDCEELQALSPIGKIPVLQDHVNKRNVTESSIIIEYLEQFQQGRKWQLMLPTDPHEALAVRFWDRIFDNYIQGPMQEIVNDRIHKASGDLTSSHSMLLTTYGMIDQQLKSRKWIASQDFSLADCAAAPALFYASTLLALPDHCTHLIAYFERLMARVSVARVLEEAKPYFSLYPFYSAIPQRFL